MTNILELLVLAIGQAYVLTGDNCEKWARDWTGKYHSTPIAVVRPANTAEVSDVMKIAYAHDIAVVPVSGNTGLNGGASANGAILLSVDRLNTIQKINPGGRTASVGAGVILSSLHEATDAHDLIFPLTFGARGSCMVGGFLSTNAGGSNVVRYGNTRDLCMGLELVLADGRIMNLMSELHKDNSGFDLRHLMIGAEGTLGIITAAVLKLSPKPRAYATAMVAVPSLDDALALLNKIQILSGGAVEAFEYMPCSYIENHHKMFPKTRKPFEQDYEVNILIELGATAPRDADVQTDGSVPIVTLLEETLADMLNTGALLDAVVATNQAQRQEMWERREAAGEVIFGIGRFIVGDVCVPVDRVAEFLAKVNTRMLALDPKAYDVSVAHLGDGNVHYAVYPTHNDPTLDDTFVEAIEDVVDELDGSFSAEHGIGLSKLSSMKRRKDPVALDVMRAIKSALDPKGILNPGKLIPPPD